MADHAAPPNTGLEEEVAVLVDVVDGVAAELGPGPVALLAVSSGAAVAATYTARHPDRVSRLVLSGGYADGSQVAPPRARDSLPALVAQDRELPRVARPTLVLHRTDDRMIRSTLGRELAALVPGAVFTALEGESSSCGAVTRMPWPGSREVLAFLADRRSQPSRPPTRR